MHCWFKNVLSFVYSYAYNTELVTAGGVSLEGIEPVEVTPAEVDDSHEPGHSRNSSNTSQMSRASGYSSLNSQSQHSRQSSSGDSGHTRYAWCNPQFYTL